MNRGKTKKKKNFNLKQQYQKSWNCLLESRRYIYGIIAVFFIFSLTGFFIPAPDFITEYIKTFIQELLDKTQGMSQFELIKFIFINNAQSSFFGLFLGVFLGVFPVILTILNGYVLGFVASAAIQAGGASVLLRLLPHGIFELPAVFISLGMGVRFGSFIFKENKGKFFREYFWNSMRVFLFVVIPLLIIAAIIEGSLITFFG